MEEETNSSKVQPDLETKKRNRSIILGITIITFILLFLPFVLVGNFSPSDDKILYITGRWSVFYLFTLLGYRLGRGKLAATFEENKKKFRRGIIVSVLFFLFVFWSTVRKSLQ